MTFPTRRVDIMISCALLLMIIRAIEALAPPPSVYPVEEYFFDSIVDHYNFRPTNSRNFALRYYVNQQHWNNKNSTSAGPVFFYAGNEADIFQFINNTGFMFEAAERFGAMVVFAEHRYYGKSLIPEDISYLTVEQAMADFNLLNLHIRKKWSMPAETAFIVFGGSYGGNLAMWLRLKNPNLWAGAIASSATPLKHVLRETNGFAVIETEAYGNVSSICPNLVRRGWKQLFDGANSTQGRASVANALGLCQPLSISAMNFAHTIHGWVSGALETMVQYGYPYPTSFYNPVPAYPFKVACQNMQSAGTGLGALRAAVDVYYNYTGQVQCYDFDQMVSQEAVKHWQRKGDHSRLAEHDSPLHQVEKNRPLQERQVRQEVGLTTAEAWGYQTCTEVYQPMPTNGVTDFEVPHTPNKQAYYGRCWMKWGVYPRPDWEEMMFMGSNIQAGSNIFLTSGQLDPWRAAGIQEKPKGAPESVIVRIIENGAHHLDLRAAHPADPPSVVAVRKEEEAAMRQWIEQWKETCPSRIH